MAVRPGTTLTWDVQLESGDTFQPLPNNPFFVERFNPEVGDFRPEPGGSANTNTQGMGSVTTQAPQQAGRYRYRSRWDGNEEFKPDNSPEIRVDVEV